MCVYNTVTMYTDWSNSVTTDHNVRHTTNTNTITTGTKIHSTVYTGQQSHTLGLGLSYSSYCVGVALYIQQSDHHTIS